MPSTKMKQRPAVRQAGQRPRPALVFFYSPTSGRCRRVEGFIAQVLQRRHNHDTFTLVRVSADERPDLVRRFGIDVVPTILVAEDRRVRRRLVEPTGVPDIEKVLEPWLR